MQKGRARRKTEYGFLYTYDAKTHPVMMRKTPIPPIHLFGVSQSCADIHA